MATTASRLRQGAWACLVAPPQVSARWSTLVKWLGKVGWGAKGLVYAMLGGLLCRGAVSSDTRSQSPQAVFVMVGSFPIAPAWLVLLGGGVLVYCTWRFVEGGMGQGYRPSSSIFNNVFRYRVSPLVSGAVYLTYAIYVFRLLDQASALEQDGEEDDGIPSTALAFLLAIAFLAAFLAQAVQVVLPHAQFVDELDGAVLKRHAWLSPIVLGTGRIGFAGRGIVFLLVSVLYWKVVAGTISDDERSGRAAIMSRALIALHTAPIGRAFLCLIGLSLIVYAAFALMNTVVRTFPTKPRELQQPLLPAMPGNGEPSMVHGSTTARGTPVSTGPAGAVAGTAAIDSGRGGPP